MILILLMLMACITWITIPLRNDMARLGQALIRDLPNEYAIYAQKISPSTVSHSTTVTVCCGIKHWWLMASKPVSVSEVGYNLVASATGPEGMVPDLRHHRLKQRTTTAEEQKLLTYGFRFYQNMQPYKQGAELANNASGWAKK